MQRTPDLRVAQWIDATEAEGPGRRFAIWVQGCTLRCPGCCNPEMFSDRGGTTWVVEDLLARIRATEGIEGVSFLGGEPCEQLEAVTALAQRVHEAGLSVMVFSGYTLAELRARDNHDEVEALLAVTDLLVDGRYQADQPETRRRWLGSANQQMHFLSDRYDPDDPQFVAGNTVEIRFDGTHMTVNGWPGSSDEVTS